MNVNFDGRTYSFEVKPGPDGYRDFTQAIRRAFNLPEDSELNITFTCDEPSAVAEPEPMSPGMSLLCSTSCLLPCFVLNSCRQILLLQDLPSNLAVCCSEGDVIHRHVLHVPYCYQLSRNACQNVAPMLILDTPAVFAPAERSVPIQSQPPPPPIHHEAIPSALLFCTLSPSVLRACSGLMLVCLP